MNFDVIFAGFGGQGVLTSGLVLAQAAMDAGLETLWSPAYGGEMRGGKAYSSVKLADAPILDPQSETLDALVAMNLPALDFAKSLKKGGLLIINGELPGDFPELDARRVPLQALADGAGSPRGANLAAVGCVIGALGLLPLEDARKSVAGFFRKKGKSAFAESGAAALEAGYNFCKGND